MKLQAVIALLAMIPTTAFATELTPDFLHGQWCFVETDFGSEKEPENRNWVFEPDGRFLMQQSLTSDRIKHSGSWEIKDGKLEIKPVYMGGPKPVEITSEDAFIFKWMAPMRIQRGECV